MSLVKCPDRDTLLDYIAGRLSDDDSCSLAEHLESCPECREELAAISDADDTLINLLRDPADTDPLLEESACVEAVRRAKQLDGIPTPNDEMSIQDQLGEYRLIERIGSGGMGKVYKALHKHLDRIVAVKVLPHWRADDSRAVERFEREMKAIGRLDHPHVVRAYDAREIDGRLVLIMEYVEGLDLAKVGRYLGRLDVADACEIARQAALGLQVAHEHGLVHRDVKPSNLMLTPEGQMKLLDLGLARFHHPHVGVADEQRDGVADKQHDGVAVELPPQQSAAEDMTDAGQAMGTADYMAPEQTSDSRAADIRADIYGLGATLYRLLAGRAPFDGPEYRGSFDKMLAHRHESVPPCPNIPNGLAAVFDRMLAKSPDDRYSTPTEAAEALAPWCEGADLPALLERAIEAKTASPLPLGEGQGEGRRSPQPLAASHSRRFIVTMLVLLFLIGGLGFAAGILIRIHRDGQTTAITVPEGSTVGVGPDGQLDVTLPGGSEAKQTLLPAKSIPDVAVAVLDNCAPNFKGTGPHHDGIRLLAADGTELFVRRDLNNCQTIGDNNGVVIDRKRRRVYFRELAADRVTGIDFSGNTIFTRPYSVGAIAVDPKTGNLWCLSQDGSIYGEKLYLLDDEGSLVRSYQIAGFDIAYDAHDDAFWVVGKEVTKISRSGEVLFRGAKAGWCYAAVAPNPQDGSAWVIERAHPDVPGSSNCLLLFDAKGRELRKLDLKRCNPFGVACDPVTGTAWVVILRRGILRVPVNGKLFPMTDFRAVSIAMGPDSGQVWIGTETEVIRINEEGEVLARYPLGCKSVLSWLGTAGLDTLLPDGTAAAPIAGHLKPAIEVPEGSTTRIGSDGNVNVELPGKAKHTQDTWLKRRIAEVADELAAQKALLERVDDLKIPVAELDALVESDPIAKQLHLRLGLLKMEQSQKTSKDTKAWRELQSLQKQYDKRLDELRKNVREKERSLIEKEIVHLTAQLASLRKQQKISAEGQVDVSLPNQAKEGKKNDATLNLLRRNTARLLVDQVMLIKHWEGLETNENSLPLLQDLSKKLSRQKADWRLIKPDADAPGGRKPAYAPSDKFEWSLLDRFKKPDTTGADNFAERLVNDNNTYQYYQPIYAEQSCIACHQAVALNDPRRTTHGNPKHIAEGDLMSIICINLPANSGIGDVKLQNHPPKGAKYIRPTGSALTPIFEHPKPAVNPAEPKPIPKDAADVLESLKDAVQLLDTVRRRSDEDELKAAGEVLDKK